MEHSVFCQHVIVIRFPLVAERGSNSTGATRDSPNFALLSQEQAKGGVT